MENLTDVKSVLRDVLSFAKKLDPDCSPLVLVDPNHNAAQINVVGMNDWTVSPFLKYFKFLTRTVEWMIRVDCRVVMHFTSGFPDVKSEIQFYFQAKEVPQLFLTGGSELTDRMLCLIKQIDLD